MDESFPNCNIKDIIEEIVGDVQDEYDAHEEENIVKLNNLDI